MCLVLAQNCGLLEDPAEGMVTVNGCLAVYVCNHGNSGDIITRQCLDTNQWSGIEPACPSKLVVKYSKQRLM